MDYFRKYSTFLLFLIFLLNFNIKIKAQSKENKNFDKYYIFANKYINKNTQKSILYSDSAFQTASQIKDTSAIVKASLFLTDLYKDKAMMDSAKKFVYLALKLSEESKAYSLLIKSYIALGELNRAMYHSDIADVYIKSAIDISNEKGILKYMPYAYNRMAAIYFEKFFNKKIKPDSNFFYKSIKYVDTSLFWSEKFNNSYYLVSNYNILGADYSVLKKYNKSNKYLLLAFEGAKKINDLENMSLIYKNIAQNYFEKKEYEKAIEMAKKGAEIADSLQFQEIAWFNYKLIYNIYYKLKDYKNALHFYLKVDSLTEISLKKNSDKHLKNFKAEFETRQTQLLLKNQKKEIKNQRIKFIIILTALIIALILIFFVFLQAKKIRKKNKLLKLKNDKIIELTKFQNNTRNMIVHDLKNPLSYILYRSKDNSIIHSARKMLNLINNILDISKYEEVKFIVNRKYIKLNDIIEPILPDFEFACKEKGIKIELNIGNFNVFADKKIMVRVIENLLNNAIRFSPHDKTIEIKAIEIEKDKALISVVNYGILIAEKKLSEIFEMYVQSKVINSKNYKSTGLGLAFCKMAIEAHEQTIVARNIPPDRIAFEFTLKAQNYDNKNISKTIFFDKKIELTNYDKKLLLPYVKKLQTCSVFEISKIFSILKDIPDKSENIVDWKKIIQTIIYSANKDLFLEYLSMVDSN